jgi:hypothetical protein
LIALSAVALSFLESTANSFLFLKIASDNRARDSVVSLAKAAEPRMNPRGYEEMNKTFSRMKTVWESDPDHFRVDKIVLVSPQSQILASSDPNDVTEILRDRKPSPVFSGELYTSALRMRKWQYPEPVLLRDEKPNFEESDPFWKWIEPYIEKFFPDARSEKGLVSVAVYHETRLDVVGAVHFIYIRGNFRKYLDSQKELFMWGFKNYSLIALGISGFLTLVYIGFGALNRSDGAKIQKVVKESDPIPPIIEKRVIWEIPPYSEKDQPVYPEKETEIKTETQTETERKDLESEKAPNQKKSEPEKSEQKKEEILDAIYLGDEWK